MEDEDNDGYYKVKELDSKDKTSDDELSSQNQIISLPVKKQTSVIFKVRAPQVRTQLGDYLFVVGGHLWLGQWNEDFGIPLTTSRKIAPMWLSAVTEIYDDGGPFEYKYFYRNMDNIDMKGPAVWEPVAARTCRHPGEGTIVTNDAFGLAARSKATEASDTDIDLATETLTSAYDSVHYPHMVKNAEPLMRRSQSILLVNSVTDAGNYFRERMPSALATSSDNFINRFSNWVTNIKDTITNALGNNYCGANNTVYENDITVEQNSNFFALSDLVSFCLEEYPVDGNEVIVELNKRPVCSTGH